VAKSTRKKIDQQSRCGFRCALSEPKALATLQRGRALPNGQMMLLTKALNEALKPQ